MCVYLKNGEYYDGECARVNCFNLLLQKSPVFHLRGACVVDNRLDSKYMLKLVNPKPGTSTKKLSTLTVTVAVTVSVAITGESVL